MPQRGEDMIGYKSCWLCTHCTIDIKPPKHYYCRLHGREIKHLNEPCEDWYTGSSLAGSMTRTYQRILNKKKKMTNKSKQEEKQQPRQGRYKKRTFSKDQTRFSLRIDDDLVNTIILQADGITKNRYINGLIREDIEMELLRTKARTNGRTLGEEMTAQRMAKDHFEEELERRVKEALAKHQRGKSTE